MLLPPTFLSLKCAAGQTRIKDMESIENLQLREYKQTLYRRIQVACALAIIKETPMGKTPESFVVVLQSRLKLQWLGSTSGKGGCLFRSEVEEYILKQQQQSFTSRLLSVLPANELREYQLSKDSLEDLEWEDGNSDTRASEIEDYELLNHLMYENDMKIHACAEFIRSIVQLKAFSELHATVPVSKYVGCISRISSHFTQPIETQSYLDNCFLSDPSFKDIQRDSGVSSYDDTPNSGEQLLNPNISGVTCVASSFLQYIISSCNGDQLVMKSVEAILNYLKTYLSLNHPKYSSCLLDCVSAQWKGSINECAIATLQKILNLQSNNPCEEVCISFVKDILYESEKHMGDFFEKENQCRILLRLCQSESLCAKLLELLQDKIDLVLTVIQDHRADEDTMDISRGEDESSESCLAYSIERMYIYLFLAKDLLRFFRKNESKNVEVSQQSTHTQRKREQITSVGDLWRQRYPFPKENECGVQHRNHTPSSEFWKETYMSWKQRLDQLVINLLENPLISAHICEFVSEL